MVLHIKHHDFRDSKIFQAHLPAKNGGAKLEAKGKETKAGQYHLEASKPLFLAQKRAR